MKKYLLCACVAFIGCKSRSFSDSSVAAKPSNFDVQISFPADSDMIVKGTPRVHSSYMTVQYDLNRTKNRCKKSNGRYDITLHAMYDDNPNDTTERGVSRDDVGSYQFIVYPYANQLTSHKSMKLWFTCETNDGSEFIDDRFGKKYEIAIEASIPNTKTMTCDNGAAEFYRSGTSPDDTYVLKIKSSEIASYLDKERQEKGSTPYMVTIETQGNKKSATIIDFREGENGYSTSGPAGATFKKERNGWRLNIIGESMSGRVSQNYFEMGNWFFQSCE